MNQPSLANAKLAVMELLWSQDRMTARDIPEPTTTALALAALCLAMSRRRAF